MKKLIVIIAVSAIAFCVNADIVQHAVGKGAEKAPYPAKIVGIKVNSSVASGTITIKDVVNVASSSDSYEVTTNIVEAGADYRVADAFVGQNRVYTGSDSTAWLKSDSVVTNISGSVTNVFTYHLAQWCDGSVTNAIVWTNCACSVKYRDVIATAPVTNIVRRNFKLWTHTPYTNTLYTGTLSSGSLSADITNKFILGGSLLIGEGTIFSTSGAKSCAYLFLEK